MPIIAADKNEEEESISARMIANVGLLLLEGSGENAPAGIFRNEPQKQRTEVGRVTPCAPSEGGAHGVTRPTFLVAAQIFNFSSIFCNLLFYDDFFDRPFGQGLPESELD